MISAQDARQRLANIALGEVGVREEGTNSGARIRTYQKATHLAPDSWPWCAAFVDWCIQQWLLDAEVRQFLGLKTKREADIWRPTTARAFGFIEWAVHRGLTVIENQATIDGMIVLPGDVVVFDFSHVGLAVATSPKGRRIETVEGNTSPVGSREGDGVYAQSRGRKAIREIVRIIT